MTDNFLRLIQVRRLAIAVLLGGVLAGCSTYNDVTRRFAQYITPYRVTVVQGNFVSSETAAKLHAGLSRDEVIALLGTPLLTDMFHAERWDYVFYFKRGNRSIVQQRDLILHFDGDRLANWTGAKDLPSEFELLSEIDGDRKAKTVTEQSAARRAAESSSAVAAASAPAANASAPAATAAGSVTGASAVPPNQAAANTANRATDQPASPASGPAPNALPPAVANSPLQGASPAAGPANSQFRLQAPSLRRGSGASTDQGMGY